MDRLLLRELVETYAQGADRRRPEQVAGCFTEDGRLVIHRDPPVTRSGRAEIATALKNLEQYEATAHFIANQLVAVDGDRATGETYCRAHHIYEADGVRRDKVMTIRYLDQFVRTPDGWRIEVRELFCDWTEDRPLLS